MDTITTTTHSETPAGRAIVVGIQARRLPQDLRDHPAVELWDADQALRRHLPIDTGIVLITKFNNHPAIEAVKRAARELGVQAIGPIAAGRVKQRLRVFVGAVPARTKAKRGTVRRLVDEVADFAAPAGAEAARLLQIAESRGIETTEASLLSAFYRRQRERRGAAPVLPVLSGQPVVAAEKGLTHGLQEFLTALELVQGAGRALAERYTQIDAELMRLRAREQTIINTLTEPATV